MKFEIRQTKKDDLAELGRLFSTVYTDKAFDSFTPTASSEYLGWLHNRCPELSFVAIVDSKIVGGYLAAIKPWWDGPHVVDGEIFVERDYRHQGIGKQLTRKLLTTAQQSFGATVIEASVYNYGEEGKRALAWHKQNGREVVPEIVFISGRITEVLDKIQ